jgi:hypothetical protein
VLSFAFFVGNIISIQKKNLLHSKKYIHDKSKRIYFLVQFFSFHQCDAMQRNQINSILTLYDGSLTLFPSFFWLDYVTCNEMQRTLLQSVDAERRMYSTNRK